MRKYWRHLIGVEIALALPHEPRKLKVAFIKSLENISDGEAQEMIDSRSTLMKKFNEFKSNQPT